MDIVLQICDDYFFTPFVYPEIWHEDDIFRQFATLLVIVTLFGYMMYFATACISYYFIFDHDLMKHPQFLEKQIIQEIECTCKSLPLMSILSVLTFLLEVRGYSKLYGNIQDSQLGWVGIVISMSTFIMFTDCGIYWIHRGLHHRLIYKHIHKIHHTWKVPSPFASHAFHPLDGFVQSFPYHLYVFLFPMHKFTYLAMFMFVNIWTVSIHDGDYRVPDLLKPVINGSAHHMDHHVYYNYNYGQFLTLWDRVGNSFKNASAYEGCGPVADVQKFKTKVHIKKG